MKRIAMIAVALLPTISAFAQRLCVGGVCLNDSLFAYGNVAWDESMALRKGFGSVLEAQDWVGPSAARPDFAGYANAGVITAYSLQLFRLSDVAYCPRNGKLKEFFGSYRSGDYTVRAMGRPTFTPAGAFDIRIDRIEIRNETLTRAQLKSLADSIRTQYQPTFSARPIGTVLLTRPLENSVIIDQSPAMRSSMTFERDRNAFMSNARCNETK